MDGSGNHPAGIPGKEHLPHLRGRPGVAALRHSGVPDPRWLGLGMGDYWFTYPRDLPAERITGIQRIPAGNWEGKSKDRLSAEEEAH